MEENLKTELDQVYSWLFKNKLLINSSKTKFMLFCTPQKKRHIPDFNISINNQVIELVNEFTFLGITFDTHLNWKRHVEIIANKIIPIVSNLNKLKMILPQNILLTIYNTLLLPHLNYGLLCWGTEIEHVTLLQKKAIRNISSSTFFAHTEPIMIRLNILKVEDLYNLKLFKLYYQLMNDHFPSHFIHFKNFVTQGNQSGYNLRPKPPTTPSISLCFAEKNPSFKLVKLLQHFPQVITCKIKSHSLKHLSSQVKYYYINSYNIECNDPNCFPSTYRARV